jgi:hypothetical protein
MLAGQTGLHGRMAQRRKEDRRGAWIDIAASCSHDTGGTLKSRADDLASVWERFAAFETTIGGRTTTTWWRDSRPRAPRPAPRAPRPWLRPRWQRRHDHQWDTAEQWLKRVPHRAGEE